MNWLQKTSQRIMILSEAPDLLKLIIDGQKYECYRSSPYISSMLRTYIKHNNIKAAFELIRAIECQKVVR